MMQSGQSTSCAVAKDVGRTCEGNAMLQQVAWNSASMIFSACVFAQHSPVPLPVVEPATRPTVSLNADENLAAAGCSCLDQVFSRPAGRVEIEAFTRAIPPSCVPLVDVELRGYKSALERGRILLRASHQYQLIARATGCEPGLNVSQFVYVEHAGDTMLVDALRAFYAGVKELEEEALYAFIASMAALEVSPSDEAQFERCVAELSLRIGFLMTQVGLQGTFSGAAPVPNVLVTVSSLKLRNPAWSDALHLGAVRAWEQRFQGDCRDVEDNPEVIAIATVLSRWLLESEPLILSAARELRTRSRLELKNFDRPSETRFEAIFETRCKTSSLFDQIHRKNLLIASELVELTETNFGDAAGDELSIRLLTALSQGLDYAPRVLRLLDLSLRRDSAAAEDRLAWDELLRGTTEFARAQRKLMRLIAGAIGQRELPEYREVNGSRLRDFHDVEIDQARESLRRIDLALWDRMMGFERGFESK